MRYDTTSQEYLDTFVAQYFRTALWSSLDDEGEPFDGLYEVSDIAPEDQANARRQCAEFIALCWRVNEENGKPGSLLDTIEPGQAGHDFWLTRNHHGAGFWDRGLGELGDELTKWAESYGSADLYVGDDELIHVL